MPYGKFRRNYYRRRYYRRGKSNLSNYSIATRTNSRSQATQIYALKKRIDNIQRRTKPEIKQLVNNSQITVPTFTAGNNSLLNMQYIAGITGDGEGTGGNNFCRNLTYKGYFSANYQTISNDVQPVNFRIVIFQTKATRDSWVNFNDIFTGINNATQETTAISNSDAQTAFNSPLKEGCARTVKILSDRKYYLSYQRPQITAKITVNRLLNTYKLNESDGSEIIGKGVIFAFILAYTPSSTVLNYNMDYNQKLAYTDA